MIQIKLILAIIKKNFFTNIGLACLYSFLFVICFFCIGGYFLIQSIFSQTYGENFLEIDTLQNTDEYALDYKFVDSLTATFPEKEVYPNFLVRIPTMMEISFFGKTLETDTFLMGYSKEYMKAQGYEELGKSQKTEDVGLSLSNETLLLLKNLLFSDLSKDTLKFFSGKVIFGKSSIFGDIYPQSYEKRFYIQGISNSLPIYAIAMDIDEAIVMLDKFGVERKDIKIHTIHIPFDTKSEKEQYQKFIQKYNTEFATTYAIVDKGKNARDIKQRYQHIFYIALGVGGLFFLICIIVITELSLQNLIYKSRNIATVALYSQVPRWKILLLFLSVFVTILSISAMFFLIFIGGLMAGSRYVVGYIGEYGGFFSSAYEAGIPYFLVFLLCFVVYYIISLAIKIYKITL